MEPSESSSVRREPPSDPSSRGSEAAIAEAAAQGDFEGALELLMDRYGDAVYRFCRQMTRDSALADDVHQLTFVQAFRALPRFEGRSTFKTWLYSIARHRCLDALKARRRWSARFELVEELPEVEDAAESPHSAVEQRSLATILERCLERIAPKIREAVLLRFQAGLSFPEMSDALGDRAPTLQARVARALPVLKGCLEGHGVSL